MKIKFTSQCSSPAISLFVGLSLAIHLQGAITGPYTVDAETLHLWHFDESSGQALDQAGSEHLTLTAGASPNGATYTGFGKALAVATASGLGNRAEGTLDMAPSGFVTDLDTGAFTFEALIHPSVPLSTITAEMQIISMEKGGSPRCFQFRITKDSKLNFINVSGNSPALAPIPTNGPNAYVVGEWFHVAVSYNGNPGDSKNFKYYWTRLSDEVTRANLILTCAMTADLTGIGHFCIGNERRNNKGSFAGSIDEVRISSSVRTADQFVFAKPVHDKLQLLLSDNFDVAATNTINGDLTVRQSGILAPTEYNVVGTLAGGTAKRVADQLNITAGSGSLAISPNVDFAAGAAGNTVKRGGLMIDFDVNPIAGANDSGVNTGWFAVSLGHTEASLVVNDVIVNRPLADFGILLRDNGLFQLFDNGSVVSPAADRFDVSSAGGKTYNIRLVLTTTAPAAGAATVELFVDGRQIALSNTGSAYSFTWDGNGTNYIAFESRNETATFDNLCIQCFNPSGTLIMVQ